MLSQFNQKEFAKRTAFYLCWLSAAAVFFVAPLAVSAELVELNQPQSGFENTAGLADAAVAQNVNLDTTTDVRIFVARLINVALGFIGIILLSLIVYGGWLYMTSAGDAEKINQAKAIFRNAIIGLVIILASWGITTFILNALFNGGGGGGAGTQPLNYDVGVSALGDGIIQSHYPERGQQDVPRNTAIIITFKEEMSLASICSDNAENGCNLNQEVIKIFETSAGVELDTDKGASPFGAGATVTTNDNKTFVFHPKAYLGSESTEQWYGVRLTEGELNRANGEAVDLSIENFYQWKFQVSTRLDLTPPRVESVFPNPDNTKDEVGSVQAATRASATIEVKGAPHGYAVAISKISTGAAVMVEGSAYSCSYSGTVTYTRSAASINGMNDALVVSDSPAGFVAVAAVNNNVAGIGCGLTLDVTNVAIGSTVTLTVAPEQPADWIMIGGTRYEFGKNIRIDTDNDELAINISDAIKSNGRVKATQSNASVTVTATQSGAAGNSITLASSDSSKISMPATLAGGKDEQQSIAVKGRADEPRNAVVQINFNEAMNPLQLQGKADAVKDYIQVRDKNNSNQVFIQGEFMISNIYKTVEFLPTESCGENMCGQPRYCLPPNANIEVWVKAADLFTCEGQDQCLGEAGGFGKYGICNYGHHCDDGTRNNPQAGDMNGVMDVAFNSLDGDMDTNAESSVSDFYQNDPNPDSSEDGADNYKWSFWVSDKIDNTSPVIISAKQNNLDLVKTGEQVVGANTTTPLSILFDKLMLSSSLKPGRNYPDDFYVVKAEEKPIHKEYFVFAKFTGRPLGYWVSKQNQSSQSNGTDDRTAAAISHTDFDASAAYGFVTGSGVQDVYQNCYNPAGDSGQGGSTCGSLDGAANAGISCCKGVVQNNATTMCYDFE
ncbi:hypothetical protein A2477_03650 [Candidatus Falkowbacteria bacterium RIFOXYC2_FULL_47_12]|uniref:SbsA Ig-like domain-containing protein n=2 Tax=Candidatus Falkowiibacteriota TaxID=1752728 RepID=A0A1F5TPL6_9BACT|nr:MAG: hypothetical protein A2242_00465 [Candidatus Falkowbacteria bacterium RIFOXYA2_FULL_47_9]OGF40850.1 MAG: hypothetical protein A2477_03650 [Candidatus Falkowbacteria bacterium RIFOXYC2_FULL_47_12]